MTEPAAGPRTDDLAALARERPGEMFGAAGASYYSRFREGYPPALFEELRARLDLDGTRRALDLGCGGGQVTVPLAGLVGHVTGVDPSEAMLAEAAAAVAAAGLANVDLVRGDSAGLRALGLAPVDLVTMGRSFHWMDRAALLADLDHLVVPGGAVALLGVGPDRDQPTPWDPVIDEVRRRYLGPDQRPWAADPEDDNRGVLAASAFSRVEATTWGFEVERDVDEVVGVTFSYSISTPERFGDRATAFATDLRTALLEVEPSGRFRSKSRAGLMLARRP